MTNNSMTKLVLVMALGLPLSGSAVTGPLEPPAPPAPSMVTLQQIYDKLPLAAPVAKTGVTTCFNNGGSTISCAGTGQDGEFAAGASVSPRFTVVGDGTVKDNLTGLIWLRNADCFGAFDWCTAMFQPSNLSSGACGLTDGSVHGEWRMPNVNELRSLMDYGRYEPALPQGHPFTGVVLAYYWTSTSRAAIPSSAWTVYARDGGITEFSKVNNMAHVWPVRDAR